MAIYPYEYGLSFPVVLDAGSPVYSDLITSVSDSVRMIMGWTLNQRIYDAIFGSITTYLQWPSIPANYQYLQISIRESIMENDYRVEDVLVKISTNSIGDIVYIEALVKITNSETILVKTEI